MLSPISASASLAMSRASSSLVIIRPRAPTLMDERMFSSAFELAEDGDRLNFRIVRVRADADGFGPRGLPMLNVPA
jgi:hypothetical protein